MDNFIQRVAVIGCGLIGSSWAACFLANGLEVSATDADPNSESRLRSFVDRAWPALRILGIVSGASPTRLTFHRELRATLSGAQFVQESTPEREDLKIELFATLDKLLSPQVIIASSSSGLLMSRLQSGCTYPERCVIGHPFNPPHLMPLVEIVPGAQTSPNTIERATRFYASLGKRPIRLKKEKKGHVANRLQAAILRECLYLLREGIVDVEDLDTAVSCGPGLRWALMGPSLVFHLSGGEGGIQYAADQLLPSWGEWWSDLGDVALSQELKKDWIEGVMNKVKNKSVGELTTRRDVLLVELLTMLKRSGPVVPE